VHSGLLTCYLVIIGRSETQRSLKDTQERMRLELFYFGPNSEIIVV